MTMESQILMLTLLSVKIENYLALLEKAKDLADVHYEKRRVQRQVLRPAATAAALSETSVGATILNAQMEVVGPFEAMAETFKEQHTRQWPQQVTHIRRNW